ncbi:hypothetical protein SAMN06265373_107121 [Shimia sagamensis]|uniref:Transposase n=1 Tax=Shimia sagamensis TaxID=1566352 RepID=A0ABY1PDT6_9RHOB|nr:hypothetical protein SAMN06265373_107121 [Shimia sagamensis]
MKYNTKGAKSVVFALVKCKRGAPTLSFLYEMRETLIFRVRLATHASQLLRDRFSIALVGIRTVEKRAG